MLFYSEKEVKDNVLNMNPRDYQCAFRGMLVPRHDSTSNVLLNASSVKKQL